jgi:putative membrane protein
MWGYYGHMYAVRNPGLFGFGLFPIFLILGVVLLIWAIASHRSDKDKVSDNEEKLEREETALEILKKRYARGEITKREFLEMKKDIG